MTTEVAAPSPAEGSNPTDYPVRYFVDRPEKSSRLTNFPFFIGFTIRAILAIPHFIIVYFLLLASFIVYFIATFAILFTGRYPEGMRNFFVGVQRWQTNLSTYIYSLRDEYPPFSTEDQGYPARLEVDPGEPVSRFLNLPIFGLVIKAVLLIPHLVVLWFVGLVAAIIAFIAPFVILITGSFPSGMHSFVAGYLRWSLRVGAYMYALTDRYPPFSLS